LGNLGISKFDLAIELVKSQIEYLYRINSGGSWGGHKYNQEDISIIALGWELSRIPQHDLAHYHLSLGLTPKKTAKKVSSSHPMDCTLF